MREFDYLVREFDGFWFNFPLDIDNYGNFYMGENEITEVDEGYINFFLKKHNSKLITKIKNIAEQFKTEYNLSWVYIQLYLEDENKQEELIDKIKKNIPSLQLLSHVVKKKLNEVKKEKNTQINTIEGLSIKFAREEDKSNVLDCLIRAYINGTPQVMFKRIGIDKFKKNIIDYYKASYNDDQITLIGEFNGDFCGHITIRVDNKGENSQAKIVDVFVINKYQDKNIGKELSRLGEIECYKRGVSELVGTVDIDNINQQKANIILKSLYKEGWKLDFPVYIL